VITADGHPGQKVDLLVKMVSFLRVKVLDRCIWIECVISIRILLLMRTLIVLFSVIKFGGGLDMFPVMGEFSIVLPLIHKNLTIFPHVPHILILGFRQLIIDNKILLCILVQEHVLTASKFKVIFHIELFQVFRSEVNFSDAFV
jgi:hypothetical protein